MNDKEDTLWFDEGIARIIERTEDLPVCTYNYSSIILGHGKRTLYDRISLWANGWLPRGYAIGYRNGNRRIFRP